MTPHGECLRRLAHAAFLVSVALLEISRAKCASHPQPQIEALLANVYALDQQLDDARLLGRKQLFPEQVAFREAPGRDPRTDCPQVPN